jgi:hypothetical protein
VCVVGLEVQSIAERVRAFQVRMTPGQVFSHETAAALYEALLPSGTLGELIDVSVPWPRTPPQTRGVRGHALRPDSVFVREYRRAALIAPADVWCQLADRLRREDLVAVGDYLISGSVWHGPHRQPFTTSAEIAASVARHAGTRGAKARAWALPLLRESVDSRPETRMRLLLMASGFPEPLIADPTPVAGGLVLHPDLKLRQWKIVFEYEGEEHFTDIRRWRSDISRRELFEEVGWRVIRVTSDDLFVNPGAFIARVRRDHSVARNSVVRPMVASPWA